MPDAQLLRCKNDVQLVVKSSDYYIENHPELYTQLRKATARPGMVVDASHLLLRLAGIITPYYLPERDISSSSYKPQQRIVFDKYDYDKIINNKK